MKLKIHRFLHSFEIYLQIIHYPNLNKFYEIEKLCNNKQSPRICKTYDDVL
jgi:hypothetical protein